MRSITPLLFLLFVSVAPGQVWQFDVDAFNAAPSETHPGYLRMTTPAMIGDSTNGTFSPTATFNGVTVTATSTGGFRDRGTAGMLTNQLLAPLLRDFIFRDGAGGTIDVLITGLPAGVYDVRTFHFDNSNQGPLSDNAFDLEVQDAVGMHNYTGLVWSFTGNNYRVHSDGNLPISITIRENGIGHRVRFNGIRIVGYYGFEVDAFAAPTNETQAGFVRMTAPGMTGDSINGAFSPTGSSGTVILTASAGGGFRDRGVGGVLATEPMSALLRDFIFEDGSDANIDLTITGLSAGTYDIRSFHFDTLSSTDSGFTLLIQDADGARSITGQVWSVTGSRYLVRSDSSPILITVVENNGNDRARFNGIEIGGGESLTSIPIQPAQAGDHVAGNLIIVNDNGGWSWYQDQKVIFDPVAGTFIASSAANYLGYGGEPRDSDIDVATLTLATGKRTRTIKGKRDSQGDDHNMGSLWIRPDGRYIHMYTGHNDSTRNSFYHFTLNPNDSSSWGPQLFYNWRTIGNPDTSGNITYNNLHYMSAEGTGQGRLYNIGRESQRSPNIAYSHDWGATWTYGGKLTLTQTASSYSNGYLKFASNRTNRIDFVTTEHHPRDYNTSIYHGYIQGGKSHNSFGVVIDTNIFDEIAPAPEDFTPVFLSAPEDGINDHQEYHRAWTTELERDLQGNLHALFTTRYGTNIASNRSGDADHRLFYTRFDGSQWHTTELARMGGPLYPPEQDYTGLGAIHPQNPSLIYISTTFDPRNDAPLAKHEIFKGSTTNQGMHWQWTQITFNSAVDNLRPAIPAWNAENTAVFWLRGDYVTQRDYDQTVVILLDRPDEAASPLSFFDATITNTTLANGAAFVPTGPGTNNGVTDNQWHACSRFGNGGHALSSSDTAVENAPALKTSITGLQDGVYDVFVLFWSRPGEDWRIRAGFSTNELMVFRRYSSPQAETNHFAAPLIVVEKDVALYRAYVGRRTVSASSAIDVYVDDFDGAATATRRTAYDGVAVSRVLPVLNVDSGELFVMTNGSTTWAAIRNNGSIILAQGNVTVTGNVTNFGDLMLSGNASLNLNGALVNFGLLDLINWQGTLPTNFINQGIVLDQTDVKIESFWRNGNETRLTILSYAGHDYQLQRAPDLTNGVWENVGAEVSGTGLHGTGGLIEFVDPNALLEQTGFYRVLVTPSGSP